VGYIFVVNIRSTTASTTKHFYHFLIWFKFLFLSERGKGKVAFEIYGILLIMPLQLNSPLGYWFDGVVVVVVDGVPDCWETVQAGAVYP
jgi:hypothetical protein